MIQFTYPELLLLAIPLWFAHRRWGRARGVTGGLRLALLGLLLLAMTGPTFNLGGRGTDVIVVADRSRSIPGEAHGRIRELIGSLEENRGMGDRIGVVTFGSGAEIEQTLSGTKTLGEFEREVLPDGSDLNDAIGTALSLVQKERPARILVLSDGEYNGASPLSAARRARELGVPVDFRLFERVRLGDLAIESLQMPDTVAPREPFQFSAYVYADRSARGTVRVRRGNEVIATAERDFTPGLHRVLFRDLLETGGLYEYTAELDVADDPLTENNRGAAVVRVDAGPRLLVLNEDGGNDNLVQALRSGNLPVDVAAAASQELSPSVLDVYRAVVIENVPASEFGRLPMEQLAQFVEDLGGGLMLTGGERSFGTGGYFKSPLDPVLPVSMELREEHRKTKVAMAVVLDRSGSMTAPVSGGRTKMDLANLGTAECVRLLAPTDMVSVIAVDSAPHVVQELTPVNDPEGIAGEVLKIESGGGGIYVYDALVAAGEQLMEASDYQTRHIILFSDAADSEEPGDYQNLLQQYTDAGITVSVIGLGQTSDPDAALLQDVAKLGRGNIMFTNDAEELPRLFTQHTMNVARNTFIKKEQPEGIPGQLLPTARLMGELEASGFPNVDGYNLCYAKPDATTAVVSLDEYSAPFSAFWYRGLGRASAVTLEVDGPHTGQFASWEHYADFLVTHARWLLGSAGTAELFVEVERDGQDAVVTVEFDPAQAERFQASTPTLVVVPPGLEREEAIEIPAFQWIGPESLQARFRMERLGTYRTMIKTGGREFTRGPAITLPYSPEYLPRIGLPDGKDALAEVAAISGGVARTNVVEILDDPPRAAQTVPLLPWLLGLAVLVLLVEIAGRRLGLWQRRREPEAAVAGEKRASWLPKVSLPRRRQAPAAARADIPTPQPTGNGQGAVRPAPQPRTNVFDAAKERAKRRMD